jgi:hypothetical protein
MIRNYQGMARAYQELEKEEKAEEMRRKIKELSVS